MQCLAVYAQCIVCSVVTIVADYRKIVAEGSNQRQSIVSFHNRFVAENSGIFYLPEPFYFYITKGSHSNFRVKWQKEMGSDHLRSGTNVADLILTQVQQGLFWFP